MIFVSNSTINGVHHQRHVKPTTEQEMKERKRHAGDWTHNRLITGMFIRLSADVEKEQRHVTTNKNEGQQASRSVEWLGS